MSLKNPDLLAEAFEAVSIGIIVIGPDRKILGLNQAAATLTHVDMPGAVGRHLDIPTGTKDAPAETVIDGKEVRINETPTSSDRAVIEIHDRTRESGLDASSTMVLASASHELKTPLTAITGFARWLQDHPYGTDEQIGAVDAIVNAADELSELIEKILLGARTEITAGDLTIEPTSVVPLLTAITDQFAVPGSSHPLLVEIDDPTIVIACDRRAMRTALGQLIENAIKYSPNGGSIHIRASRSAKDQVAITVTDHGIGFDPADASYLFVAFYQGDRPVKGGVGLGLSIVRRLTEAQGGTVTATGNPGTGAAFTLTLPAPPEPLT